MYSVFDFPVCASMLTLLLCADESLTFVNDVLKLNFSFDFFANHGFNSLHASSVNRCNG